MGHVTEGGGTSRAAAAPDLRAVPATPPGPFPASLPDRVALVGRDADTDRVLATLEGGPRLVTVTGPGGVGKTALATEVAHRLWQRQAGSVLFVALTPVADADRAVAAVAAAAGWDVVDDASPAEQLAARLGGHSTVIVLDNCEQIDGLANVVDDLLDAWPDATLLTTSRRPLALAAEHVVEVAPLPLPHADAPWRTIAANPAVAALVAAVRRRVPDYAVTRANGADLAELCIRLDGLPLALELAAARLHLVDPAELIGLLDARFAVLHVPGPDRNPHHRRLWTAIDWSYRLLTPAEQQHFRRLATFVGGFTLDAAAQVLDVDRITALDALTELTDQHLVYRSGSQGGASRFDMLATIVEFARAELDAAGETDAARAAHARWATDTAQALHARISTADQGLIVATFDAERANLRAALGWQLDHDDRGALRLAHGHWMYWLIRGSAVEGLGALHAALAIAGPDVDRETANALMAAGNLHDSRGELHRALELHERAVTAFTALGDRSRIASSWHTMAAATRELGDLDRAERLQRAALEVQVELGNARDEAVSLNGLGVIAYRRNDPDHAMAHFERAAELFESVGDRIGLAHALDRAGLAHLQAGDAARAVTWHRRAQALAEELDDVPTALNAMTNVAAALLAAGDADGAAEVHDRVAELATQIDDARITAYAMRIAGDIADHRGEIGVALDRHVGALDGFSTLGYALETVESLERLAVLVAELDATGLPGACLAAAHAGRRATGTESGPAAVTLAATLGLAETPDMAAPPDGAPLWAASTRALVDELGAFAGEHTGARRRAQPAGDPLREFGLTQREAEVARLVVTRLTDPEIAAELYIGARTVATHVSAVLRKLGVSSRRDVADRLAELGIDV